MIAPRRIGLIFTGGTITMIKDGTALRPPDTPLDFLSEMPELQHLHEYFDERPHLAGYHYLFNVDSTNMTPAHWQQIARTVYDHMDDYDGFVITHGTDTMAYSASALAYMLHGLQKPVVLTGSQVPLTGHFVIDARNNLINAFRAAALGVEKNLREVVIMFGSKLLRGTRTVKYSVFDFEAFTSFNIPELGRVGLRFQMNEGNFFVPAEDTLTLADALEPNVVLVKITPGMSPRILDAIIDTGVRGVVIEAFGSGNIPNAGDHSLMPSVRRALANGVAVVIATQAQVGAADLYYQTGTEFIAAGAISAYDMTPISAVVKLMWLLGQHGDDVDQIRAGMRICYAGELDTRLVKGNEKGAASATP